jgi:hypothetical protein
VIIGVRVRPDGSVWYRLETGEHPQQLMTVGREEPLLELARPGDPGATGRPFVDWAFENRNG